MAVIWDYSTTSTTTGYYSQPVRKVFFGLFWYEANADGEPVMQTRKIDTLDGALQAAEEKCALAGHHLEAHENFQSFYDGGADSLTFMDRETRSDKRRALSYVRIRREYI